MRAGFAQLFGFLIHPVERALRQPFVRENANPQRPFVQGGGGNSAVFTCAIGKEAFISCVDGALEQGLGLIHPAHISQALCLVAGGFERLAQKGFEFLPGPDALELHIPGGRL